MYTLLVSTQVIGANVCELRKQQGLTQAQLGNRVGPDQKKVSLIENGNPNTRTDSLLRLLSALGAGLLIQPKSTVYGTYEDGWPWLHGGVVQFCRY